MFKALCAVVKNLKGLASICFKAIIEDSVNKLIFEMVNVNGIKRIHKFSYQGCHCLLTYSLTHLLTYSLTHLLTYSLTHLLTYSLTYVLVQILQWWIQSLMKVVIVMLDQNQRYLHKVLTYLLTYLLT